LKLTIAGLRKPSPYGVERVMGKTEKLIKKELQAKVEALRKKAEEFKKQGDISRAFKLFVWNLNSQDLRKPF
jgi:hypothetical protein